MTDTLTPQERSRVMAAVKGRDTTPELRVRRIAHALGYRYRLHRRDLPGRPDLVFPSRRKAVFVHGCFWHRHQGCPLTRTPKSRLDFWKLKFERNVERDARAERSLEATGWSILVIWECQTRDSEHVALRLTNFLGPLGHHRGVAASRDTL